MKAVDRKKRFIGLLIPALIMIIISIVYLFIIRTRGIHKIQRFILISLDDLRADRLGCYGNDRNVSPFIDRLAEEGIKFNLTFVSYAFTPPSHASMFTSLYPSVFDIPLDASIPTLASIFSKNGFKTAAFTEDGYMIEANGLLNGFQEFDDHVQNIDMTEKKALSWLDSNKDHSFFLFLHTFYIHTPFEGPNQYFDRLADPNYTGPVENDAQSTRNFMVKANAGKIPVTSEDIQRIFDIYDSQILRADDFVYSLVQKLKELKLYQKTMLIITSDHGEQFFEFGHFDHRSAVNPFADVSTRVPLIVHCPLLQNHSSYDELVEMIDLAPTLLETAGIKGPDSFQGRSLYPMMKGKPHRIKNEKEEIFYTEPRFWGIRTKSRKLIFDTLKGKTSLYDLRHDPQEKTDIYPSVSSSKQTLSMMNKLVQFQEKNSLHRNKMDITNISLAEELSENPLEIDNHTILFIPFDSNSFYLRKGETIETHPVLIEKLSLPNGRNGKSILLEPEGKMTIPLESPLFTESGSVEFWIKLKNRVDKFQKLLDMSFKTKEISFQLVANIVRGPERNQSQRSSFQIFRERGSRDERSLFFSCWLNWKKWNHVLIAWEPEEVLFLVNGDLSSRIQNLSADFFRLGTVQAIEIAGNNCLIDEFRISTDSRLARYESKKKVLDKTVRDKLKALGYIR